MGTGLADTPTGLDDLYQAHFADLVKVAYLLTGSAAAAEDAVHEVFLRCLDRLADIDHPGPYLRTAVVNECRSRHRRSERFERHQRRSLPVEAGDVDLPHEVLETREALSVLTDRQRAAVVLRYFVDLPDDDIAAILGCRPATVRSLVHRALERLRKELG